MEFISHSEAETEALGEKLARSLPEHGVVIAMYGELGAGKTAFVRGLARGLEVDGAVTSPTFTIVNELYGKRDLFHFDMYRLGSADELFDIGWEDRGGEPLLILGIETSAKACSAALCRDGELLAQSYERTGLTHSRTLLPMIENMLSNTETPKDAIDMVAVAQGPGSFTGIRIGISTAKGLCWGLDIPAVGVSTLEAMAQSARFVPEGTIVCPAMDARRSQLYNALFTVQNGALVRLTEDRAIAADALAEELSGSGKSVWVLGDGWAICEKALKERGVFCTVAPEELRWQTAFGVCLAAQSKTPTGAEDLLPVYLRLSQAERERQSRMNEA